ncbi:MAG: hypothetical protein MK101_05050 [Phycisphaerales bacterium]|nr:hypothetical protein [Phycisphaerales bacterium]
MPRPYEPDRDLKHVLRIWSETGWYTESDQRRRGIEAYFEACDTIVEEIDGVAEVGVSRTPGTMRVLDSTLDLCVIAGVYASLVARQGGHATRMTAQQVAAGVADGAVVASLGIFDQGFYDRVGFGCGPYVHRRTIEPSSLKVPKLTRPPVRLGVDDAAEMHACRLARRQWHGAVNIPAVGIMVLECCERPGWGMGFRDSAGILTHCMWFEHNDAIENGPWTVSWMAWADRSQLLDLLGVVRSLGDQVMGVRVTNPPGVSMQDFVDRPFAWIARTKDGPNAVKPTGVAYRQHRICDLPACMEAIQLASEEVRFNLTLEDPIERFLPQDAPWRGCGGDWTITAGAQSSAVAGHEEGLELLEASLGAFTRFWLGARRATALHLCDAFDGPESLLSRLDGCWRLPEPAADWDY